MILGSEKDVTGIFAPVNKLSDDTCLCDLLLISSEYCSLIMHIIALLHGTKMDMHQAVKTASVKSGSGATHAGLLFACENGPFGLHVILCTEIIGGLRVGDFIKGSCLKDKTCIT